MENCQDQKLPVDPSKASEYRAWLIGFAQKVHATMEPGMSLTISWDDGGIIVPGRPSLMSSVIITRPAITVTLKA